jgi:hypothetical protein
MVRLSTRLDEESDTASPSWKNGPRGVAATAPATTARDMAPPPNGTPPFPSAAIVAELQQPFPDMARSRQAVGYAPETVIVPARNPQVALYSTGGRRQTRRDNFGLPPLRAGSATPYTRRGCGPSQRGHDCAERPSERPAICSWAHPHCLKAGRCTFVLIDDLDAWLKSAADRSVERCPTYCAWSSADNERVD